jgi:hypothetical protein
MNNNMDNTIDQEWELFLKKHDNTNNGRICSKNEKQNTTNDIKSNQKQKYFSNSLMESLQNDEPTTVKKMKIIVDDSEPDAVAITEAATEGDTYVLNISTKTKILYLNQAIDIHKIFWNIPIIEYWKPVEGVVKKQIKIVSKTIEEYNSYKEKLKDIKYYTENIIKEINNPAARSIKFKNEIKITVGISKKDIMNCRGKVKHAFYNCFAIIIRLIHNDVFREIHVKVFNTGKMEIPGITDVKLLNYVKTKILEIVQPYVESELRFVENTIDLDENVLINSNFNCGYYINREKLHYILRSDKYGIEAAYDPCSYPGVKCKFYFNNELGFDENLQKGHIIVKDGKMKMNELDVSKKYTEVSFMIFRTGSCLIVGNCSEKILLFIFEYIKKLLIIERPNIIANNDAVAVKNKKNKIRRKNIKLTQLYFDKMQKI